MAKYRMLMNGCVRALLAGALGCVTSAAFAEESGARGGGTETVVVTAKAIETAPAVVPLATTYSEGTITSQAIENLSSGSTTTIQTLLNKQPSITAYTDGPLGLRTNIYFRAFNSGQFAETYDGVALNDVFNAGVTGQASVINNTLIIPDNLDSVQIYRGINNPAVNSYNSLGGTINYLPRMPTDTFGGVVGGSYGSFNTFEVHGRINTGDFHGIKQTLSFSHAESDGWNPNTPDRNTNVYYAASYAGAHNSQASLILIFNRNDGYTPFNIPAPLLQQNGGYWQWPLNWTYEKDKDTSFMGILDYKVDLASNITLRNKFFGGFNDYKRTSYSNPAVQQSATQPYFLENTPNNFPFWLSYPNGPTYDPTAAFGSPQAGTDYHFYGYRAWGFGWSPSLVWSLPGNTITVGGNITYGKLHSREYWYGAFNMPQTPGYNNAWDEHDSRLFASLYAQYDLSLMNDRLHITPGVKYVFAHTTDHDAIGFFYPISGSVRDNESFASPTIGLNYKATDQIAVYFAFGQNIKFPDISAFYGAFQSDINNNPVIVPVKVNPEYVNDYELGARYQNGGFSASVDVYREDFSNTFVNQFNAATGTSSVTNGGASQYQGVEVQLAEHLPKQSWGDLSGYLNYAHNQAKFTETFTSDYAGPVTAGQPLANVPEDLVSLGGTYEYAGFRLSADGRYVGKQHINYLGSGTPSPDQIKSYFLLDLGASKTIALNGVGFAKAVKFSINADNVLNKYYYNEANTDFDVNNNAFVRAVTGAPRSVVGKIEVSF